MRSTTDPRMDHRTGGGVRVLLTLILLMVVPSACSDPAGPDPEPVDVGEWLPLGEGLTGSAHTFLEWNGGLVVGGEFRTAGDQPARNIAFWDGTLWHPFGTGLDGTVLELAAFEGGLVAEVASDSDSNRTFRWTGEEWQPMGSLDGGGFNMYLAVHDDVLYALALTSGLHRWTESGWEAVQIELDGELYETERPMAVHGNHLFVGAGSEHLARWDGQTWDSVERPEGLRSLVAGDGELFASASGTGFLRWTGSGWEDFASPPPADFGTMVHQGQLVVAALGGFPSRYFLARWDGSEWSPLPGEMDTRVGALGSFGNMLLAGGEFTTIDGSPFRGVAGIVPTWVSGEGGS